MKTNRQAQKNQPVQLLSPAIPKITGSQEFRERAYLTQIIEPQEKVRFAGLIELSHEGILVLDGMRIKFVNLELLQMFGYEEKEEMENHHILDFIAQPFREKFSKIEPLRGVFTQKPQRYVFQALRKDGSVFDAEIYFIVTVFSGDITVQGLIRDITEQNRAQRALKRSEERLRSIIQSMDDLILLVEKQKRFSEYHKSSISSCRFFTQEELIGKTFEEVFPADIAAQFNQAYTQSIKTRTTQRFDFCLPMEGVDTWFSASFSRRLDNQGSVDGVTIVISNIHQRKCAERELQKMKDDLEVLVEERTAELRVVNQQLKEDIAERKRVEKQLRDSEEKYRLLIEQSGDAIYLRIGNHLELVNSRFVEMFGISREEAAGMEFNLLKLAAPRSREKISELVERMNQGSPIPRNFEFVAVNREGKEFEVEASISTFLYKNKQAWQGVMRDVSERKQLERELHHSQKMEAMGRLAGGVAHDFNNILTVISGFSELSLLSLKETDPMRNVLKEIAKTTDRATSLTRQLLTFSRKHVIKSRTLNLNEALSNMEKMLKRIIGEDIELDFIQSPELKLIESDATQLEQVIVNLVVNARDAMPDGGKLTIETANVYLDSQFVSRLGDLHEGEYVLLRVSDTGIGMDPNVQSHAFDPFFTTKAHDQGTGLGLSTVYGIVKHNRGHIRCESEVGVGTTFEIYLPLGGAKHAEQEYMVREIRDLTGQETILIVEDDPDVRVITVQALEKFGYTVFQAASGEEAIQICNKLRKPINLILTDLVMPNMDGVEVTKRLREKYASVKVIYMSGYVEDKVRSQFKLEDDAEYLCKPFKPTELVEAVRYILDR